MNTYIGIDLGTSGVKMLLVNERGNILGEENESYPIFYPQEGWSEQNPEDWWKATIQGLKKLLKSQDKTAVKGISFGGQMHGLVVLDKGNTVIRPCILWNDGRTEKQTDYLNEAIGKEKLSAYTGNIAFAGFTAPKVLWLKENEPENYERIAKVLLPKDYLAYRFSGVFCTDLSDASGTLLLDVKNREWSEEMLGICGLKKRQLPRLYESYEAVGTLKKEVSKELGLSEAVKIIAGAGDNAAAAVGTGTVGEGGCNVSLGTSGTIFLSSDTFAADSENALHSFCHADGKWHRMGCILSAASSRKWWLEEIVSSKNYEADEKEIEKAKKSGVIFLPYLMGERSPHNDVNAKGAFIGLSATTTRGEMSKAVMEGVAFALKDCLEAARGDKARPKNTKLCGGGAKSKAWRQILSDVLSLPVQSLETEQGPAFGGAILAMVGCGEYETVEEAAGRIVRIRETIEPNAERAEEYKRKYEIYKRLYPLLKDTFSKM